MVARVGLVLSVIGALGFAALPARADFYPPDTYPVGAAASAIGYGDFTGDGIPDLVVAEPQQNDVVIFPGRANGTFGPPLPPISVGSDPVAVSSCTEPGYYNEYGLSNPVVPVPDFKFEGFPGSCDLVVSDAGSDDIAVLLSHDNGTFAPPIFIPVDGTPGPLTVTGNPATLSIVFTEPQQDRLGLIVPSSTQPLSFSTPTYTDVGTDPDAIASALTIRPLGQPTQNGVNSYFVDWPVYVADGGSDDVREFSVGDSSGSAVLSEQYGWQVGSMPDAVAAGAFGVAVADRDSGDVRILGTEQQGDETFTAAGPPIPVGADPIAMTTVTEPGGVPYGDLAVVDQGTANITLLRETPSSTGLPGFTATSVPGLGAPNQIVAAPFRAELAGEIRPIAAPQLTDLAELDPSGTAYVLLQDAPRITQVSARIDYGTVPTGDTAIRQFTLTNLGRAPASIDRVSNPGADPLGASPFSIVSDACSGKTLAPGQSCNVSISFSPQTPGEWDFGIQAFSGSSESSAFAGADLHAVATLSAVVSTPTDQVIADAIRRGIRATAMCSAACNISVRAYLRTKRFAAGHATPFATVSSRFAHIGRNSLEIPIKAIARSLSKLKRAQIVLRASASATAEDLGAPTTVSEQLKQVEVTLVSPKPRKHRRAGRR